MQRDPSFEFISAGSVPLPANVDNPNDTLPPPILRPLTKAEIMEYVQLFVTLCGTLLSVWALMASRYIA
jgi:hypothetical protein